MREDNHASLPPLVELHRMCTQRAGHLDWPLSRLAAILEDFLWIEWRMVAGRCLDYINQRDGVTDGPRTLRTFMEREVRDHTPSQPQLRPPRPDLDVRCPGCGETFNISAELRRRRRLGYSGPVSVCETCFDQHKEQDATPPDQDPSSQQRQEAGDEGARS